MHVLMMYCCESCEFQSSRVSTFILVLSWNFSLQYQTENIQNSLLFTQFEFYINECNMRTHLSYKNFHRLHWNAITRLCAWKNAQKKKKNNIDKDASYARKINNRRREIRWPIFHQKTVDKTTCYVKQIVY